MKGIELCSLSRELRKVPVRYAEKPSETIRGVDRKLAPWSTYIKKWHGERFSFYEEYYRLPLQVLSGFSFDEICKLHFSTIFMMERSVDTLFHTDHQYEVVRKIESSMWRWGHRMGTWNEVVEVYNGIRCFSLVDDLHFELRLDYSTYFNERGYSQFSRTFLDGVFAYLVYYKGKHVMTIGFSVTDRHRLLIQQVQSAQRSGNRYLYKLPKNRMEFVISRFRKSFPGYRIFVVDGNALTNDTIAGYRRGLKEATDRAHEYRERAERLTGKEKGRYKEWQADKEEECEQFRERIAHLKADKPRLVSFYGDIGQYTFGPSRKVNGLLHHRVFTTPRVCRRRKNSS